MSGDDLKVIFIIGKGRSGSTLLDNVLGGIDNFFSLGEVLTWRSQQTVDEHECGCGRRVGDCPLWSQVLQVAYRATGAGTPALMPQEVQRWQLATEGWRRVPRLLREAGSANDGWVELNSLSRFVAELYQAVARITGARVLVDSSKWPANPGPLGLISGIKPYVIHLIRDPRAVAFSWTRSKRWSRSGRPMPKQDALYSSASWIARNLLAERVCRRLGPASIRLRYEDFVNHPGETLRTILEFVGEGPASVSLDDTRRIQLGPNHTLMGNPSRFVTGLVEIRNDDEWRTQLAGRKGALVTAATLPLLLRYGYSIRWANGDLSDR